MILYVNIKIIFDFLGYLHILLFDEWNNIKWGFIDNNPL